MQTMTKQHLWVKHVITPVEVLMDDDNQPVIIVDPDQQVIAEDNAAYGCDRCGESMVTHLNKPCEPEEDND